MNERIKIITYKNESMYLKNMALIKKKYPEYYDQIELTPINDKYQVVKTESSDVLNILNLKTQTLLYDFHDPILGVKTELDDLNLINARVPIFLGFGLGYVADYYGENLAKKNKTHSMIIVEKDLELFKTVLYYRDLSPLFQNADIYLILGMSPDEFGVKLNTIIGKSARWVYSIKCIKPVYCSEILNWDGEYYLDIITSLKKMVLYILNHYGNDPLDSIIGLENMLENVDEIIMNPGINLLKEKFVNIPAIVASTGPSLIKQLDLLKKLQSKAIIVAPDASLKILMEHGIKPHIVTSLERVKETAKLLEGYEASEVQDVYFAGTPVITRETYKTYPGPRIIVYRDFDHFRWLKIDRGILSVRQSSGNMAYNVALSMGCNPIILIGQDLAYGEDGGSHASGSTYGDKQLENEPGITFLEVEGNNGQMVRTNNFWNLFKHSFELDIALSKSVCINATEGGAFIKGTKIMRFKDVSDEYLNESYDIVAMIKDQLSSFNLEKAHEDKMELLRIMDKTKIDVNSIIEICEEGFEYLNARFNDFEQALNDSENDSFDFEEEEKHFFELKRKIETTPETYQLYLMHVIQPYNIKTEINAYALFNDFSDKDARIKRLIQYREWFFVIKQITKLTLDILLKTITEVESLSV